MTKPLTRPPSHGGAAVLVLPALIMLVGVALVPILSTAWLSLQRSILVFGERRFIGLANYAFLLQDARFASAFFTTLYFTAVAVALELLLALPIALLLNARFYGRGLLRASVLIPWAVPTAVSAKLWAFLFHPDLGLTHLLWPTRGLNLLGSPGWALHAAILVDVWKTTPFVALMLLAGLQTIPGELYRAARIDGASNTQMFLHVTLPLLWPSILLALLFRTLDAFRVFDTIYVLTEGGPGNSTETLSIYAYKTMMRSGNFGYGATLSLVTFAAVFVLSLVYLQLMRRAERAR
jgi:multiple sugar transport system permease protein